ncbi:MAG: mercury methylation ferredoxin HgcB [Desulfobulbaceae bacterium]|nr:mercury methylation ferredoxin HgcB [Desulfobulbaceae bacterium]HIJ90895.1 4Fe-4S binding protein [Deltaproteobacteria bacterium]
MAGKGLYLRGVATLRLEQDACIGCGMCLEVCPQEVFALKLGKARIIEHDACMECGACMMNCPVGAVWVQSGVGCAQAVFNAILGRGGTACCAAEGKSG